VSRFTDFRAATPVSTLPSVLPPVDWASINAQAPAPVAVNYQGPDAQLPPAEVVVFTWTDHEWSAMDHVFLHGAAQGGSAPSSLVHKWLQYSRSAPGGSSPGGRLWGYYQLIDIQGPDGGKRRVLLMKSNAHLAHPPWLAGLEQMVAAVVSDAQPAHVYSIGTAGGATLSQCLGYVSVTDKGTLQLKVRDNTPSSLNGKTFPSPWFPNWNLMQKAQQLFLPLSKYATLASLQEVLDAAKRGKHEGAQELQPFSLNDLMNAALNPANLRAPQAVNFKGTPLLTTDTYYIAPGDMDYAALEMDDAAVGNAVLQAGKNFVFVRNISDTLVPAETPAHQAIPEKARGAWSSALYDAYGLFTSYNGALAAWALIAAS